MIERRTTVGIYIFNPLGKLLVVRPTESTHSIWGIPKGKPNGGEVSKTTGIREVYEETGIDLLPNIGQLRYVGEQDYLQKPKKLIGWTINLDEDIPVESMRCESLFKSRISGKMLPEVDGYRWVDFNNFRFRIQAEQVILWERYLETR